MPQTDRIILPTALKDEAHEIRGALATLQAIAAYLPQLPNGIGPQKQATAQLQIRRITDSADRIRILAEAMEQGA